MSIKTATLKSVYDSLATLIDLPTNARKIVITLEVGKLPTVECELRTSIVGELAAEAKRYTLREIEAPEA